MRQRLEIGAKINALTVIRCLGYIGKDRRNIYWECRCDCGSVCKNTTAKLQSGERKSCGCDKTATIRAHTKHGHYNHPLFLTWYNMVARCTKPTHPAYKSYGGRGISVCDRWLTSFDAFVADMGPKPESAPEIDRIDNNGNYCPENCRWATRRQNVSNTRRTVFLSFRGKTMTQTEWAAEIGVAPHTISRRRRLGKPIEEVLAPKARP